MSESFMRSEMEHLKIKTVENPRNNAALLNWIH